MASSHEPFLSAEQVAAFHRDGFLVLPFWDDTTVDELRASIRDVMRTFRFGEVDSVFTTDDQRSDAYFLRSGGNVSFFWEKDATPEQRADAPELAINKIGHALHDLVPSFSRASYDPRLGRLARDLGVARPLAVQSMYIFKQPGVGGAVNAHQDGAFLYTEPQSCLGLWFALEDASVANGALFVVPGSHREGVARRFRRTASDDATEFQPAEPVEWDLSRARKVEVPRGTLVVLHNAVVHFSHQNTSSRSRHAYTLHVVDGSEGVSFPRDNWLRRPEGMPFRPVPFE